MSIIDVDWHGHTLQVYVMELGDEYEAHVRWELDGFAFSASAREDLLTETEAVREVIQNLEDNIIKESLGRKVENLRKQLESAEKQQILAFDLVEKYNLGVRGAL